MIYRTVKDFLLITFGSFLAAAAIYFFMLPSHVAVGSVSALAMVLSNFVPLPVSLITLAFNGILLLIGFLLIGPEFGVKTIYTSVLIPVIMGAFELLFPNFQSLTQDSLLDVLCYILVVGMGMAILFLCNASSGGLDIVSKIMNKYLNIELGRAGAIAGMVVALTSAFCYDTKTVVLSLLGTYFGGMIVDHFIFGLNVKRRVCVISTRLEQITGFVLQELHSGASLYQLTGAYDNATRTEMITIVDKQEYRRLMDFIRAVDPKAFVTVYTVSDLRYQPKVRAAKK